MVLEFALSAIFVSLFIATWLVGRGVFGTTEEVTEDAQLFLPPVLGASTQAFAFVFPIRTSKREQLQKDLLAAGRFHQNALINFLSLRNLTLLLNVVIAVAVICVGIVEGFELYVAICGVISSLLIFSLPPILLSSMAKRRKSKIEKAIPDALDLISMAVAGGLPITTALERVNDEIANSYPSLSQELGIICNQTRTGSIETAFEKFAERIQVPEIVSWASLMKQSNRLGGGIASALQEYANRIREDRNNRIERTGNTASVKLLLPVVLCICPPIAVMLIGPALLDFRDFLKREGDAPSAAISQFNEARDQARTISVETRN